MKNFLKIFKIEEKCEDYHFDFTGAYKTLKRFSHNIIRIQTIKFYLAFILVHIQLVDKLPIICKKIRIKRHFKPTLTRFFGKLVNLFFIS